MLLTNVKANAIPLLGVATSWIAAITATQDQLEWWFKMVSFLFATIASVVTIGVGIKNWTKKKNKHVND